LKTWRSHWVLRDLIKNEILPTFSIMTNPIIWNINREAMLNIAKNFGGHTTWNIENRLHS